MDTQKLHDFIDKVIGKKGPLRVPAYWMHNLMNELVSYIENIATSLRAFFSEGLNQKLDCLKSLTYQEFYEAHINNKLVEGATYHIKDYKPVLSVRETRWPIVEYPKKYDLYIIYSRNIVRYESETAGVTFYDNTAFDGYVMLRSPYSGGHKYKIKYITHDCEFAGSMYWVPNDLEWIQEMTVFIYSGFEGIKELDLLFTVNEDNQISYVDKNTNEIYAVNSVDTKSNKVTLVKDSKYGYGNILKYSLRTYGTIIRMQDEVNNFDVCYDFIGIKPPFGSSISNSNVRISGYPSGYLPRISLSYREGRDITIINSTDIEVSGGSNLINTVFIDSYRIKIDDSDVETTKFVDSRDITILEDSVVKNTVFSRSSEINCNSGVYEIENCCVLLSSYIDLTGGIYDCNLYNCYNSKIKTCTRSYINNCNWVDIEYLKYSNIKESGAVDNVKVISGDNMSVCGNKLANLLLLREGVVGYYSDSKMNQVNIPTTASLVTDESSGKTVDIIIQELQGKIDALGGGTALTSLVEIPSWEVGDDARMYLPEQYAEQVLSGNCSIMYQMLIYVPLRVSGRNLMFLSYVYPTTGGEASLGCRLVSINVDDRSVIEDSTEVDYLTSSRYQESYGPYRVDISPYVDFTTPFPEKEFTALYEAISNGRNIIVNDTRVSILISSGVIMLTAVGPLGYSSTEVLSWSIQTILLRSGEPIVINESQPISRLE